MAKKTLPKKVIEGKSFVVCYQAVACLTKPFIAEYVRPVGWMYVILRVRGVEIRVNKGAVSSEPFSDSDRKARTFIGADALPRNGSDFCDPITRVTL